jgi:hypothetical protein
MKIKEVTANGRKRAFEVRTAKGTYYFPFAKAEPIPSGQNPVVTVAPDRELGNEGFTYQLRSGQEGSVHIDSVLEVNRDPKHMADLLMYKLSLAAKQRMDESGEPIRDVAAALGTSPPQIYRLIDPTNYTKSFNQLIRLLNYLDCDVNVEVTRSRSKRHRVANPSTTARSSRKPPAPAATAAAGVQ